MLLPIFLIFLLYSCFLPIHSSLSPIQLTNTEIQIGINPIMPDHFNLYSSPTYTNNHGVTSLFGVLKANYQTHFSHTFTNIPNGAIGIYHLYLNPQIYASLTPLIRLRIQNTQRAFMALSLTVTTPNNHLTALSIFTFAADLSKTYQLLAVSYLSVNTPYLENYQPGVYEWRYHNQTLSFYHSTSKPGRVRYVTTITGHRFIQNNYTMLTLMTGSTNSTHYYIKIGVHNYTRLRQVDCYIIAIDAAYAESKLRNYQFQSVQYTANAENILKNFSTVLTRLFITYNYIYARNSSSSSIGFNFHWNGGLNGTILRSAANIRLNVLEPYIYDCMMGYYFDPLTKTCVDSCTLYPNTPLDRTCNSCIIHCTRCIHPAHCQTCISTRQPDGNNYRCLCATGYYQKSQQFCQLCSVPIFGCHTCNSANNCTKCNVNLNFNPTVIDNVTCECQSNRLLINNICQCIPGYYDNSGTCEICHYSCVNCNGPSDQNCTECNLYVYRSLNNGRCQCATQWGFDELCTVATLDCDPAICYLDPAIDVKFSFDASTIVKDEERNVLIYKIGVEPAMEFLNYIHFNLSIDTGLGAGITSSYQYENGVITLYVLYGESVQGNITDLLVSLETASQSFIKVSNFSQNYAVLPANNLAANTYTEEQYLLSKIFKYSTYVLIALSFGVFFVGTYSSKVVVSEMMGIIQTSFFGLLMFNFNDPMISTLNFLKYSNGFNDIMANQRSTLPNRIYLIGYSEIIMNNLNIIGILVILPFFLSLIFLVISKIKRRGKLTLLSYSKLCLGECTIFLILFSLLNLTISTTLFASYATLRDWRFSFCVAEIAIIFIFVGINLLLYGLTDYNYFGQYKCMFKWNKFQLNYYYFHIAIRLITGVTVGLLNYTYICGIVISGLFFLLSLVTIIKRPYSDNLQSIRSSINLLVGSIVWMLYSLIAAKGATNGNNFYSRIPIVIILLLYGVMFLALGFIVRQFLMMGKIQSATEQDPIDFIEIEKQKHNEMMKKKIEEEMQKNGNQNNFAKKLFLNKNKKPRKKKPIVSIEQDFNTEVRRDKDNMAKEKEEIRMDSVNVEMLYTDDKELTLARIRMVDAMLKEGLI